MALGGSAVFLVGILLAAPEASSPRPNGDGEDELLTRLHAFHQGPGVCLRYVQPTSPASQDVLRAAAQKLVAAGVDRESLGMILIFFVERIEAAEKKAHKLPELDEYRQALLATMTPAQREAAAKAPDRLDALIQQISYRPPMDPAEGKPAFDALDETAKAALEEIWRTHPEVLHLRGYSELLPLMELEAAADRLRQAGSFVLKAFAKTGRWPEALPSELTVIDGKEVHYYPGKGKAVLTSSALLPSFWIEVVKDGVRPYTPPACKGVSQVSITRAELEAWIAGGGPGARITPEFDEPGGIALGLKVFAFEPGSFMERVGLCEQDVVVRIGPYDMNTPENPQKAYLALKDKSKVTLSLLRGGREKAVEVVVKQRR